MPEPPTPPGYTAAIAALFRGRNFLTPTVLRYGSKTSMGRPVYYELSTGFGLNGEAIWGVSVRDFAGAHLNPDASRAFSSESDAEDYIRDVL